MKKYTIEFYSNNGYKLGESLNEYEDLSAVEQHAESLLKDNTSIKITSKNEEGDITIEFLKVDEVAKVVLIER